MIEAETGSTTVAKGRWLAAGGLAGALLASSCCVLPLVVVTLGVSGAWIGKLNLLEPYSPIIDSLALLCVALGFWHVYFRRSPDCEEQGSCGQRQSQPIIQAALWLAAILIVIAVTADWWAPLFY